MGPPINAYTGLILLYLTSVCQPLFVPEQLTTLLSFLYTNIPPIRKGTDSRVGFGFRLGPNADFQVLFELGPQQNTEPLTNLGTNSAKRDTKYVGKPPSTWLETWHLKQQMGNYEDDSEEYEHSNIQPPVVDRDIVNHLKQLYINGQRQEENDIRQENNETIKSEPQQIKEDDKSNNLTISPLESEVNN